MKFHKSRSKKKCFLRHKWSLVLHIIYEYNRSKLRTSFLLIVLIEALYTVLQLQYTSLFRSFVYNGAKVQRRGFGKYTYNAKFNITFQHPTCELEIIPFMLEKFCSHETVAEKFSQFVLFTGKTNLSCSLLQEQSISIYACSVDVWPVNFPAKCFLV